MKTLPYGNDRRNLCGLKLLLFSSFVVVTLFVPYDGWGQQRQMHTPVITRVYAPDKGAPETNVKVYIEAEDAGSDMDYIYVVIERTGYGSYAPDRLLLDPQHKRHVKAFIEWIRAGAGLPEGTQLTVRIFIRDMAGNISNQVVLPFTFVSGASVQQDLPEPFGGINIPRIGYMGAPHYEPGPF